MNFILDFFSNFVGTIAERVRRCFETKPRLKESVSRRTRDREKRRKRTNRRNSREAIGKRLNGVFSLTSRIYIE